MYWTTASISDTYIVDNTASKSRIGLTGKAKLRPGWTAGYTANGPSRMSCPTASRAIRPGGRYE